MKIGILTGGGDVPGLNPCIKALVYNAIDAGAQVVGVRRGWGGLLEMNPDDPGAAGKHILELTKTVTRTIDRTGGTFLHSSRTNPGSVRKKEIPQFLRSADWESMPADKRTDHTPHILKVLKKLGVDALVTIGGDDTQSYALRLHREGFPVVAIPKTMDNDIHGTDYCIGFSTAVTRTVDFITNLRTVAGSHERIAIVELFGRNSGETSIISAYLAGVDRAIISEVPFDPQKLATLLAKDRRDNPSNYAIMTISEGATMIGGSIIESGEEDAYGHKKLGNIGLHTADQIRKHAGIDTVYQQVAYLMRSGQPDALDRMVAISFANLAIELLFQKQYGKLVALREGKYTFVDIDVMGQGLKRVDVPALYDVDQYRPRVTQMAGKPMFLY